MRKHGKEAFVVEQLYCGEDALQKENSYIISENAEYNMTKGGEANQLGRHWNLSEETKQKMRKPKPPRTKEHCENLSKAKKRTVPWNKGQYKPDDEVTPHALYMREYKRRKNKKS